MDLSGCGSRRASPLNPGIVHKRGKWKIMVLISERVPALSPDSAGPSGIVRKDCPGFFGAHFEVGREFIPARPGIDQGPAVEEFPVTVLRSFPGSG
ncbi:hypothetical protein [Kitasatospora purpeofusca]|uniref:Uncharacterized protein n=1 Tax=Kitasatospora purpeofusca TaxID=67352 RepID=A0ABZ1TVI1_9ACTN|nr:hypothetical protein [Kitasatospora purpeofusca]